ncbi:unnamed protein product [Nesidiocoris tenuis]|uniref:Uncharacterized protein n=1 Tax=Nesidiocoris tenuis TaxID=355587 RepID=A0A6H5FZT1_9HEMI|nr:unnamed protein product [Nesidiocoris tenuis]
MGTRLGWLQQRGKPGNCAPEENSVLKGKPRGGRGGGVVLASSVMSEDDKTNVVAPSSSNRFLIPPYIPGDRLYTYDTIILSEDIKFGRKDRTFRKGEFGNQERQWNPASQSRNQIMRISSCLSVE